MAASILVIDDSKVIRAQLIGILREVGMFESYYEAGDGIEGLQILSSAQIDLVLCDLMMPRMDGFQFLAAVKKHEEFQHIPIVILSEREESSSKVKGLRSGARDYITKPFDSGELIARIMVQLNIKALQDDMRRTNELLKELSITDHLTHLYNRRYMAINLGKTPDFVKLAEAYGAQGFRVESIEDFQKAVKTALNSTVTTVIDVPIGSEQDVVPFVPPGCGLPQQRGDY